MASLKKWLQKIYSVYVRRDEKTAAYYDYIEGGGEALRLDYPLTNSAIIIDVGGYVGDFAADMTAKFNCRIDVFEPVAQYAEKIRQRFLSNSNVQVIQAGLGATERGEVINIEGLGSSVFDESGGGESKEEIQIISAVEYIHSKAYSTIDLIKINIEGGEYELLNSLLEQPDLIKNIRYFQVQFHDFVPDAREKRAKIQQKLSETHKLMWDFPYIWESWELK